MNIVETVAPISIENLKKYFTDKSTVFSISYNGSSLKGAKLLTYLSNLDIPCDINFKGCSDEEINEFLQDYLSSNMIVNIPSVEMCVIHILGQAKGVYPLIDSDFIEHNKEVINKWISKIDSLTLYNMFIVSEDAFKDFVLNFEEDDTKSLEGVNFISLLKHETFYDLYQKIDKSSLKYYSSYFNEYMFKGKSLFNYWANENNPLFLLTYTISSGDMNNEEYAKAVKTSQEELTNVAPV